ncbi:LOW QUALITY PROTEIN: intraflagellar transport protein 20 homolog [Leptonychotes weddellii]|uniref:LOW QUALITY PROTEIN: intraflagellar transport protein 20 homolog n=1 Tax=Leptonychotes weddellii TaxID=9713 RepID=A0A7F8QPD3_LEPWE|nr:LOW QUALITY PROTEIN: intraflagellar transport protein 20 homolog [Leptonychotes weddellii]
MTHFLLAATSTPSEQSCSSRETGRETAMAKDILGEAGLHFDELNKLRVLDPEVTQQTIELKEECKDFVDKIGQFQKIVGGLIELVDQLAKEAENEKMKVRSAGLLNLVLGHGSVALFLGEGDVGFYLEQDFGAPGWLSH